MSAYVHQELPAGHVRLAGTQRLMNVADLLAQVAFLTHRLHDMTTTHGQRWHYADAIERFRALLATAEATARGGRRRGDPVIEWRAAA